MTLVADVHEVGKNHRFRCVAEPLVFVFYVIMKANGCGAAVRRDG